MNNYSQKERDLIEILEDELGFAAMRCPASGGATSRDLPDVLAGRPTTLAVDPAMKPVTGTEVWAFEVKYRSKETCYCDDADVDHLVNFAMDFGAKPRFACRWDARQGFAHGDSSWYIVPPGMMPRTEESVRIGYDEITDFAPTLRETLQEPL